MGFFNKKENNEKDRPETVPAEAVWNADENEWELGEKDEDGNNIGEWKWWLAPNGHLVCHTFYHEDGNGYDFTRFHQDGTFSMKGTYKNGVQDGQFISQQSENETTENYNPRDGFKAVTDFEEGYVVEEHYFDKDGNEVGEAYISKKRLAEMNGDVEEEEYEEEESQEFDMSKYNTEEESKRWIKEGKQFKNQLNAFLDAIYSEKEGPEEPNETRKDMAQYVYLKAIEMNEKGEHKKLRELFPPAHEPFEDYYDGIARDVDQVIVLKDDKIVIRASGYVYVLEDDKITEQENLDAIGISANKEYIAKVTAENIQVFKDWNAEPIATFDYPEGYGKATEGRKVRNFKKKGLWIDHIDVFNDGKKVLLSTRNGVFIVEENKSTCVFPTQTILEELVEEFYDEHKKSKKFKVELDYLHGKLSPDNTKIAAGFQMSDHFILQDKGNGFETVGTIQARSEYPHTVCFHDKLDHIALSSCHFQQSGTIGMDLKHLPIDANASWYQEWDDRFDYMDDLNWIYASVPFNDGYLLGTNNGYLWYIDPKDTDTQINKKYLHVGSTIKSMDFSKDKKFLVIGTFSGYVIKIDLTAPDRDETLITNINLKETNRWVFWQGVELIW